MSWNADSTYLHIVKFCYLGELLKSPGGQNFTGVYALLVSVYSMKGLKSESVRVYTPSYFNVKWCKDRSKCQININTAAHPLTHGLFTWVHRPPKDQWTKTQGLCELWCGENTPLFSLTCNWNLGFPSITNINNIPQLVSTCDFDTNKNHGYFHITTIAVADVFKHHVHSSLSQNCGR